MQRKKIKVFLLQEVIPHYRLPIFERIEKTLNVDLIVFAARNTSRTKEGISDIRVTPFRQKRLTFKQVSAWYLFIGLPFFILKHRPDVIIGGGAFIEALYIFPLSFFLVKMLNIKTIRWGCEGFDVNMDTEVERRGLKNLIKTKLLKSCDGYIAYSTLTKRYWMKRGIQEKTIFVAYNSLDTDELLRIAEKCRKDSISPFNPHRVLFIGRLIKSKKVDNLIRAFQVIRNAIHDAELIIIGDGPEKENLEALSKQLCLDNSIRFIGKVYNSAEKGKYLASSSLFVLPSLGGLSIVEAMSFGLPVVCTKADGTEEDLIENNKNGFLVKPDDITDLSEKIITILKNTDLQKYMSANAKETILKRINIHKMIEGFEKAIQSVCERYK